MLLLAPVTLWGYLLNLLIVLYTSPWKNSVIKVPLIDLMLAHNIDIICIITSIAGVHRAIVYDETGHIPMKMLTQRDIVCYLADNTSALPHLQVSQVLRC
jgi:hypothetical protein